jgi:septum formation protein
LARVGRTPLISVSSPVPVVVLASASPARLSLLRAAGLDPLVRVSHVDEPALERELARQGRTHPAEVCAALAEAKAAAIADQVRGEFEQALVIGADSVLDLDGAALGKPRDADEARARWRAMRGRTGVLRTGHTVIALGLGQDGDRSASDVAHTGVTFADLDDATIDDYVASGEPLHVAGAFTIDGLGGPFVESIDGDPSTVVGLSLPLTRRLVESLGVRWTRLWRPSPPAPD